MVIQNGYSNQMTRHNGVMDKVYSQKNAGLGVACHSIEGSVAAAIGRFDSTDKDPDGSYTSRSAASVMFINPKEGLMIQCYPVTASTWTSGNSRANCTLWAVESEGVAGEPLNANQVKNMFTLRDEFEAYTGRKLDRGEANIAARTLWQHNEVWDWATPNAGPTACPSGRYRPFFEALEVEAPMTPAELARMERLERLVAANGYNSAGIVLTGETAMAAADADGGSLFLGLGITQRDLQDHINTHGPPPGENAGALVHTHATPAGETGPAHR